MTVLCFLVSEGRAPWLDATHARGQSRSVQQLHATHTSHIVLPVRGFDDNRGLWQKVINKLLYLFITMVIIKPVNLDNPTYERETSTTNTLYYVLTDFLTNYFLGDYIQVSKDINSLMVSFVKWPYFKRMCCLKALIVHLRMLFRFKRSVNNVHSLHCCIWDDFPAHSILALLNRTSRVTESANWIILK